MIILQFILLDMIFFGNGIDKNRPLPTWKWSIRG
jgi:hypothetical protein